MDPSDITWRVYSDCAASIATIKQQLGEAKYAEERQHLQQHLTAYFDSGHKNCTAQTGSIAPLRPLEDGSKTLKVRWGVTGGKSSGIRLVVVARCEERVVEIHEADWRKDL